MSWTQREFIINKLKIYGHGAMFIGFQLGLVVAKYKGVELHDDTCNILTSTEYLALY
jgi:hypothetical protein